MVHIAPPCGTASRARERQLSPTHHGPKPLRSSKFPEGLPWLGPAGRARVDAANCIYNSCASFCEWLTEQGIAWSVENPGRSYMWETPSFVSLRSISNFVDFDSCMHGGLRAKHTSFLCGSEELLSLALRCDGQHDHLEWGLLPDGTFSTATEAEYPDLLCTDGACEPGADGSYVASVGGVIIGKSVKQYFGGTLDGSLVRRWMDGKKHIIGLVELYAVVLARAHWDSYFKGCRVIFFIDKGLLV